MKFVVNRFEMPKSISTVQNQIDGCERNVKEALAQCAELRKMCTDRERKETVKRLTMRNSFKKKALLFRIPTPPSSQEAITDQD